MEEVTDFLKCRINNWADTLLLPGLVFAIILLLDVVFGSVSLVSITKALIGFILFFILTHI